MAFDLIGRIKIKDDGASKAIDRVRKSQERLSNTMGQAKKAAGMYADSQGRLRDAQGRFATAASRSSSEVGRFRDSLGGASRVMGTATRSTGGLIRQLGALGAAYLTARGAASLFDKTIVAAAHYEMSKVTFDAMFGKEYTKQAEEYLAFLQERADISPLELSDFISAGKSFIPLTKDVKQLEKATNLMERLAAMDPMQGSEGAALALREMFSGDTQSLVERFEMPRKLLNDIKNLDMADQLRELDKLFEKMGASNELIERQSQTSLGQYNKAIGRITTSFREMGTRGLDKIAPLIRDFNKWLDGAEFEKIKDWGANAFAGLAQGAADAVRQAGAYIDKHFINNPDFQKLPDIPSKIVFIFEDVMQAFRRWWDKTGSSHFQTMVEEITQFLVLGLKAAVPQLTAIGLEIGSGIANGVVDGMKNSLVPDAIKSAIPGARDAESKRLLEFNAQLNAHREKHGANSSKVPMYGGDAVMQAPQAKDKTLWDSVTGIFKGHSGGLAEVPYNGYYARLHKGETVLTREEAKRYRGDSGATKGASGGGGGRSAPTIVIQNVNINSDMDFDNFVSRLERELAQ